MQELKERILKDGQIYPGNILKVNSFLNHQIDVDLLEHIGKEFYTCFREEGITKILTIEASGIAIGCMTAQQFHVPMVFAKKTESVNISRDVYTSSVYSFTHKREYTISVEKQFLKEGDVVLIVDDFMANGLAVKGLIDVVEQAGAKVAGVGIVIEKAFQNGGREIREMGYKVVSLAKVRGMNENGVVFEEE